LLSQIQKVRSTHEAVARYSRFRAEGLNRTIPAV
jgi:hypothetical protein